LAWGNKGKYVDIATLLGLVIGVTVVTLAIMTGSGGDMSIFLNLPGFLIVCGGTFASTLIKFPISGVFVAFFVGTKAAFVNEKETPREIVDLTMRLVKRARKVGLLGLEKISVRNNFFRKGIQLCVDGREADVIRKMMTREMELAIEEDNRRVNEYLRNAKSEQERLAFLLSRISPASAYKLTAMNLGGTNTSMKNRYEDQMLAFRDTYNNYIDTRWRQEQDEQAALRASQRQGGGAILAFAGSGNQAIDSSDMPRFIATQESLTEVARASLLDFGLLSIFTFLAFAGAFFAFVRYDVR